MSPVSLVISRYICLLTAFSALGLGLSVIIGWHAHIMFLLYYQSGTRAMTYNTAILFLLSAGGILAVLYNYSKIAIALSVFILVIAGLSLSEYIWGIDLGIDQLLFSHYEEKTTAYPGRIAPYTALSFIFIALALFFAACPRNRKFCLTASVWLSFLILSLALMFVVGYLSKLSLIYEWGGVSLISFNTAIGFILLSIGIISLVWNKGKDYQAKLIRTLPIIVTFCIFIVTIVIAQEVLYEQNLNNYESNVPIIIYIIGTTMSILVGVLIYFLQEAYNLKKIAQHSLSLINATLESTADGILVTDLNGNIVHYNKRFVDMWRISENEIEKYKKKKFINFINKKVNDEKNFILELNNFFKNSDKESLIEIKLENGCIFKQYTKPQYLEQKIIGRVWSYRDITLEKQLENKLLHQGTHDILTELPNKTLLLELMQRSFEAAKNQGKFVALLIVDIDHFTEINDAFGHGKGDYLLQLLAARFQEYLPTGAIIGRIGGDEFLIISNYLNKAEDVTFLIQEITKSLEKPFHIDNHVVKVTCCIGITFYPKDGQDVDILLSNTEIAMIRAREKGPKTFQFYTQDMNAYALDYIELYTELQQAMERNQFLLYYQPIFNVRTGKFTEAEALIRWKHPQKGMISPKDFISVAEESGLMTEIGEWVLRTACHQVKQWCDQGFVDFKISVNISAHQFKNRTLTKIITDILSETQLDPKNLVLELTESAFIEAPEDVIDSLNKLQNIGINVAIDDFGTGYSSLSYLRKFQIDQLKIDRSFIIGAPENQKDKAIVQTIIAIAKNLGMQVIAEGVETKQQLDLLTELDCGYIQGFYMAHPMPFDECTAFLKQHYAQKKPSKAEAKQVVTPL